MPIKPENRARYPKDWRQISLRVRRERAGNRCECRGECGHEHAGRCPERNGRRHSITGSIVVLTVAHLNHRPEDNREANLRAMCQRCHLAHDRSEHARLARRTFSARRIAALNNLELFG